MAKRAKIDTPTQRAKLSIRREPYWHKLQTGGYLGYRSIEGGGTWVARWRDPAGQQHYSALRLPLTDPKQAFDEASKLARAWFKEADVGVVARRTVKDAAIRYVEDLRLRKGDSAARDAQGRIDRTILPALGKRTLDRLRMAEIKDWRDGLIPSGKDEQETRKAKDSANRNLTTLKALLNYAWEIKLVGSKDEWARVKPFKDVRHARDVFLTPVQRTRLLKHCQGAFRNLVEAGLLTGARYGELCALTVGDFDKGRQVLSIRKGKTGARTMPLSNAAVALFSRLSKGKLPGAILLTRDDGMAWLHSDQDELMREAAKRARLPKGSVFYTLRHTHIATAINGGVDIHMAAKICGTSVRMIELHYGKLLHDDARAQLNQIAFV